MKTILFLLVIVADICAQIDSSDHKKIYHKQFEKEMTWIKEFLKSHKIHQKEFDFLIKYVLKHVGFFEKKLNEDINTLKEKKKFLNQHKRQRKANQNDDTLVDQTDDNKLRDNQINMDQRDKNI